MDEELTQKLTRLLDEIIPSTTFDIRPIGRISAAKFKEMLKDDLTGRLNLGSPAVKAHLLALLVAAIEPTISPFRNNRGWIGVVGFRTGVAGKDIVEHVESLAMLLVKGAVILGPRHAAGLFVRRAEESSVPRATVAMMEGVVVDGTTRTSEGVELNQLAKCRSIVPSFLSTMEPSLFDSTVIIKVSGIAKPPLFLPANDYGAPSPVRHFWGRRRNPGSFPLETFCEMLSLVSNHYIHWRHRWAYVGNAQEYFAGPSLVVSSNIGPPLRFCPDTKTITKAHLNEALELCRLDANNPQSKDLKVAIERWRKSKVPYRDYLDRFIELRIALEALYLADTGGELRFRLALRGAWHLGRTGAERKEIYDILRKFYSAASTVIHAGRTTPTPERTQLLKKAQDICRDGILKRLKEEEEPDWDRLIFSDLRFEGIC